MSINQVLRPIIGRSNNYGMETNVYAKLDF